MSILPHEIWESGSRNELVNIGSHKLFVSIDGPPRVGGNPLVIVFVGAGASVESWDQVKEHVSRFARILLYDRSGLGQSQDGPSRATAPVDAAELSTLLTILNIQPPYLLVAHSYGGCIAREFLQHHQNKVAGMVLVDTGTETQCQFHKQQYDKRILGTRPLSVIFAKLSTIDRKSKDLDQSKSEPQDQHRKTYENMADAMQKQEATLKKAQLRLSRNNRLVELDDCGHSVHRYRPEIVAREIKWVLLNMGSRGSDCAPSSLSTVILDWVRRIRDKA